MTKKNNDKKLLTHAVVSVSADSPFILQLPNWPLYGLGIEVPAFPVATLEELVANELPAPKDIADIPLGAVMSPRFLSGLKMLPATQQHRLKAVQEGKLTLVPEADELYLYPMEQADEVVVSAARCFFISLANVRHNNIAAFAYDRVTGEMEQVGIFALEQLVSASSTVRVVELPPECQITIGEFNSLEKTAQRHALADEPVPHYVCRRASGSEAPAEDADDLEHDRDDAISFFDWDTALEQRLDKFEAAYRDDRQPFSGAARRKFDGWEDGHPTLQLIVDVASGNRPEAGERVRVHLSKCIFCTYETLSRSLPALSLDASVRCDE